MASSRTQEGRSAREITGSRGKRRVCGKNVETLVGALQSLLLHTCSFSQLMGYNFLEGKDSPYLFVKSLPVDRLEQMGGETIEQMPVSNSFPGSLLQR